MADDDSAATLTPTQSHALFDILTHRETYAEIEDFKHPGAIHKYGPPFQDDAVKSSSPILQNLLSRFVLRLPGLRDVSADFWKVQVEDLIQELAEAELSESYDKGMLGIRKTLATAASALIEYPARGCLGGFPEREPLRKDRTYDTSDSEDVIRSWQDCLQSLVYGDLIDEVFQRTAETDDLSKHSSLVQGMHEFIIVNLASFMHYTLILSPEGPTLLKMIENVQRLVPYILVRQTLKIGNVASMINAMMKVVLAKVSVASMTNWIGLSTGADEGQNLMQQIISQVLHWDKRDLKNRAEKIEKSKNSVPKAVREALLNWMRNSSREEHEECRRMSKDQGMSIVAVILSLSSGPSVDDLNESEHANALEWLALQLAVRDRQEIVRVLCRRNPDHLTAAVYDVVHAYTPMIRQIHQAVNLSDTVWDFERFVSDMLKISKPTGPKGEEKPPTVEDYVDLLHRHQSSSHKFLHQVAKNGKQVTAWWYDYVRSAVAEFRAPKTSTSSTNDKAGALNKTDIKSALLTHFSTLAPTDRSTIISELNDHQKYLDDLHAASAARIRAVIDRAHSTPFGPGAYLARWQDLLDSTLITPGTAKGEVRTGANRGVKEEGRKDISGEEAGFLEEQEVETIVEEKTPRPPSAGRTVELFGEMFRELLSGSLSEQ